MKKKLIILMIWICLMVGAVIVGTGVYAYFRPDPHFPTRIEISVVGTWQYVGEIRVDGMAMSWAQGEKSPKTGMVLPPIELEQLRLTIAGEDVTDIFSPDGRKLLFRAKKDGHIAWLAESLPGLSQIHDPHDSADVETAK